MLFGNAWRLLNCVKKIDDEFNMKLIVNHLRKSDAMLLKLEKVMIA